MRFQRVIRGLYLNTSNIHVFQYVCVLLTLIIVCSMSTIPTVNAIEAIFIRPDGSINPPSAPIQRINEIYVITSNLYQPVIVQKDHIIIDGKGHTIYGAFSGYGFDLTGVENVTVMNSTISYFYYGIHLFSATHNRIVNNTLMDNGIAISLVSSSDNEILDNSVSNNGNGIWLYGSSNNFISRNNLTAQSYDGINIFLFYSSNNTLRNNNMSDTFCNFRIKGVTISDFIQDIDTSNTIENHPMQYLINANDTKISLEVGFLALINCTDIIVENLNLTNNYYGALIAWTNSIVMQNVTITNNFVGVELLHSSDNNITLSKIRHNKYEGVVLSNSSGNLLTRNDIINNALGTVYGGIWLSGSTNNTIYHNNIVDNGLVDQVIVTSEYANIWDDGYPSGGNYWGDHDSIDLWSGPSQNETGSDGIVDTPYEVAVENEDRYPLMGRISTFNVTYEEQNYYIDVVSSSTISDLQFDVQGKALSFKVKESYAVGFSRITIPHTLLESPYNVTIDGAQPIFFREIPGGNNTFTVLYFTYAQGESNITIIPEFSSLVALLVCFILITSLALSKSYRSKGMSHTREMFVG